MKDDSIISRNFCTQYQIISDSIHTLYSLPGCECAGLAHSVVDDDNVEDYHLLSTIEDCNNPENEDRPEKDLVIFIMQQLLKVNKDQRMLIFELMTEDWNPESVCCLDDDGTCDYCTYRLIFERYLDDKNG